MPGDLDTLAPKPTAAEIAARAVVDDIKNMNATGAFAVVEQFYKDHHTDQEWAAFNTAMATTEESILKNIPHDKKHEHYKEELTAMFHSFVITGLDENGEIVEATATYGDNYEI